jgi:urea transport system substrate-binding protein
MTMAFDQLLATRRNVLQGAAASAVFTLAPSTVHVATGAPNDFKIGLLIPLSGPASLFGPSDRACAELGAEEINRNGGILGRPISIIPTDAGGAPADTARSVIRLMLQEKVELFIGSHDGATRDAVITAIKGKTPFVFCPVSEGGVCARNVYCLGETPEQQAGPAIRWLVNERKTKRYYLVGDDYVWPRKTSAKAKEIILKNEGTVIAEEYVPFGAPNKFEELVTRIKSAKPDAVLSTLVGSDNVNFNRTFAGFGLDKDIVRFAFLLEENTLNGIGADSSNNLFSCMGYFANDPSAENTKFKAAYFAKFGAGAPQLSTLGVDLYAGVNCAKALVEKAGGTDASACMAASEGLRFVTASGPATMHGRQVDKTMFLAHCKGADFEVIETFKDVKSGDACN